MPTLVLTAKEAAKCLGVSTIYIYKMIETKEIHSVRITPDIVRIPIKEFEESLKSLVGKAFRNRRKPRELEDYEVDALDFQTPEDQDFLINLQHKIEEGIPIAGHLLPNLGGKPQRTPDLYLSDVFERELQKVHTVTAPPASPSPTPRKLLPVGWEPYDEWLKKQNRR
jgi:excisionase family DNA binding protein